MVGASAARLADATGSALRRLGTLDVGGTGDEVLTARAYAEVATLLPGLVQVVEAAFRHHVDSARVLAEQAGGVLPDGVTVRLAVGFADLAGFTRLSASLDHASLARLLDTFAEVSGDVVRRHSGRLVKLVGDAVLFVTPTAGQTARVCGDLLEACAGYGLTGRAGAAFGPVLDRDGDVFGPVVNLAARLVAQAPDGRTLVSAALAGALDPEQFRVQPVAPVTVRGYDEPVPAALVSARAVTARPAVPVLASVHTDPPRLAAGGSALISGVPRRAPADSSEPCEMPLNRDFIGRTYPADATYEVGREHIRAFADAIGDPNPVYLDPEAARAAGHPDVIAPPTFLTTLSFRFAAQGPIVDPELGLNYALVVHGEQQFAAAPPGRRRGRAHQRRSGSTTSGTPAATS